MAKGVTGADIFGGMFRNIPEYEKDAGINAASHAEQKTPAQLRNAKDAEQKEYRVIERSRLKPFHNHPFRVTENEEMQELAESIRNYGVIEPVLVRPDPGTEGEYEIISGHRRNYAAGLAGLTEIPVHIKELNDDEAAVQMVDANNKREFLLPSEKAWAYRIKADALRRQGKRSDLISVEEIQSAEQMQEVGRKNGDCIRTVQRYIRLTCLLEELLKLVDEEKLSIGSGYSISFFSRAEQGYIAEYYRKHQLLPDKAQTAAMMELQKKGKLDAAAVERIMEKRKKKEKPVRQNITLPNRSLKKYFPENATKEYMEQVIFQLLERWAEEKGGKDDEN